MVVTAVGASFSRLEDELTAEQKAWVDELKGKAEGKDGADFAEGVNQQKASSMMEPVMGKCMLAFTDEQRSKYEIMKTEFIKVGPRPL